MEEKRARQQPWGGKAYTLSFRAFLTKSVIDARPDTDNEGMMCMVQLEAVKNDLYSCHC